MLSASVLATLFRQGKNGMVAGMSPFARYFKNFDPRGMSSFRRWLGFGCFYDAILLLSLYGSGPFERLSEGFRLWITYAIVIAVAWFSHVALLGITFEIYSFRLAEIWRLLHFGLLCIFTAVTIPFLGAFYFMFFAPLLAFLGQLEQAIGQPLHGFGGVVPIAMFFVALAWVGATIGYLAHSLRTAMNARSTEDDASARRDRVTLRADALGGASCAVLLFGVPIIVGLLFGRPGFSTSGGLHAHSPATPCWALALIAVLSLLPHLFLTGRDLFCGRQAPLAARQFSVETGEAKPINDSP